MIRQLVMAMGLFLTATAIADAASVRAVVDRNQATVGESIALQVTITGGKGEADFSGLADFKTISRGSSSSFQMINGRTSRQLIHNYVLIPLNAGNLTIPAIPVTIDGKVHYTTPISVTVSKEPPADSGKRDVYVTADVSEPSPWIGQQLTYTFRLFNAVQVADAKFQAPDFKGFNAEELEKRKSYRTVINGREFVVTEVIFILVSVKTGVLEIEPAVLQVGLLQRSRRPKPFSGMDSFFGRTEMTTRILQTDSETVNVRALPLIQPGTSFSGLVGRFEISATLNKMAIKVGDSTTLAVTIAGSGNIMDAPAPTIPAPSKFKTYADNPEEQVQLGPEGYSGSKIFRTALVPVQLGQYRIDPIVLAYFDVDAGQYRKISTSAFNVTVSPSDTAATDIDVFRATPTETPSLKKRVEFTGRDILPLKESLDAIAYQRSLSFLWFALFLAIPAVGFLIVRTVIQMTQKDDSPGRIMAERAKQALKTAASAGSSDADFLSALYRALVSAILGTQGIMGTSLTWSEAKERLVDIGWDADDAASTARLLEAIESFNYSGGKLNEEKRADLMDRTRKAVRRLIR
ncbi:MAG: protein BatD [Desulfosarcina sp.]|nr:protein BatD [Desulfosarcina sp.]MBC2743780.1 protein BatD [Desulfosarcina sp.]MBC2766689.1 protein BatD [Desulfosarcina sp.]